MRAPRRTVGVRAGAASRRALGTTVLHGLGVAVACAALATTCTTVRPWAPAAGAVPPDEPFSHAALDRVLQRFVDGQGRVDYRGLRTAPDDLERYYAALAAVSPESHPGRFPTRDAALAYWINAYNAAVLTTVLRRYPIMSVRDVRPPRPLFFLPRLAGFFVFQRVVLGGRRTSLYVLEHDVILDRFDEPRVHFALNCASASCPRLPQRAFTADGLETELAREARRFVAEPRNVRIDPTAGRIELSAIFDWYRDDFTDPDTTLLDYLAPLLGPEQAAALARCAGCTITFMPYDWTLNDRALVDRCTRGPRPLALKSSGRNADTPSGKGLRRWTGPSSRP